MEMFDKKGISAEEVVMDGFNINSGRFKEMLFDSVSEYPTYELTKMLWIFNKHEKALAKLGVTKDIRNNDGDTVLIKAVRENTLPVIKELLEFGFDPNTANDDGVTPLISMAYKTCLRNENAVVDITTALLDKGAKTEIRDDSDRNVFSIAEANENLTFLNGFNEALKQKGMEVNNQLFNTVNKKGRTITKVEKTVMNNVPTMG